MFSNVLGSLVSFPKFGAPISDTLIEVALFKEVLMFVSPTTLGLKETEGLSSMISAKLLFGVC